MTESTTNSNFGYKSTTCLAVPLFFVVLVSVLLYTALYRENPVDIHSSETIKTESKTTAASDANGSLEDSIEVPARPKAVEGPYGVYQGSITVLPVVKRGTLNGKDGFIVTSALGEFEFVQTNASTAVGNVEFLSRTFNEETQQFDYDAVEVK